jgi:hypothetical protein
MLRSVTYRQAFNAFLFTGLWFVLGAVVLWSPVPGALGIGGAMFGAWLLLFFGALGVSGLLLTAAALNGAFPPRSSRPERRRSAQAARRPGDPMWAPRSDAHAGARREG